MPAPQVFLGLGKESSQSGRWWDDGGNPERNQGSAWFCFVQCYPATLTILLPSRNLLSSTLRETRINQRRNSPAMAPTSHHRAVSFGRSDFILRLRVCIPAQVYGSPPEDRGSSENSGCRSWGDPQTNGVSPDVKPPTSLTHRTTRKRRLSWSTCPSMTFVSQVKDALHSRILLNRVAASFAPLTDVGIGNAFSQLLECTRPLCARRNLPLFYGGRVGRVARAEHSGKRAQRAHPCSGSTK